MIYQYNEYLFKSDVHYAHRFLLYKEYDQLYLIRVPSMVQPTSFRNDRIVPSKQYIK